jgi:hypothetical protein
MDRQTDKWKGRRTFRWTKKDRQTNRQAERQMNENRQTSGWTDNGQIEKWTSTQLTN